MEYTVWLKLPNQKRFCNRGTYTDAKAADKQANFLLRGYALHHGLSLKVVCDDGYSKETLIYA